MGRKKKEVKPKEEPKEIARVRIHNGHKTFEFDFSDAKLREPMFIGGTNTVLYRPHCIYFTALNIQSAVNKLRKKLKEIVQENRKINEQTNSNRAEDNSTPTN